MIFLLVPLALFGVALLYQNRGQARDRRSFPPPGRMVETAVGSLHIHEMGRGNPVVVFESGIGASSLSWASVQPRVAEFTQTVSYDRAGLGWSALWKEPYTVERMVEALRLSLLERQLDAPYILVGHSFGGLLVRAYASLFPGQVAGLVLVDPVSIGNWVNCPENERKRLQLGVKLCRRGAWAAELGIVRAALGALLAGGRLFPSLAARMGGPRGTAAMTNLVGEVKKLPPEVWPMVRAHWSDPKCFRALARHLDTLPESARYAAQLGTRVGVPTIILSAASASEAEIAEREQWVIESGSGRHIQITASGHWLHLERPEVVVEAIRELVAKM